MDELKAPGSGTGLGTILDTLPFGTDEDVERNFSLTRKERKRLPDGLSKKQMYRDVLMIAGPSLAEMLLSSLVRMIDQMMVGTLGPGAIAAIGLVMQPSFLFMSVVMALNTGATALIARARGAGDVERANSIMRQALVICGGISILCTALGVLGAEWMVNFMAAGEFSQEVVDQGVIYFKIQSWTFMIPFLTYCITAVLRGTGNSKPAMYYNITVNIVHIIFNWLLINGNLGFPKWGVAGAAIATVIGQFVGLIWAFKCVFSGKYYVKLRISLKTLFKFDKVSVHGIMTVGVPAMIEQLFMRTGLVLYSLTVAGLGEVDFATYNICLSIQGITLMNGQAFAVSATALIGQSLGKKRLDMADHYGRFCRQAAQVLSIVMMVVFLVLPQQLLGLYLSAPGADMSAAEIAKRLADNARVLELGTSVMFIVALMQPIQCSQFVVGGILRGAGDTRVTALIVLITTTVMRPLMGYFLVVGEWQLFGNIFKFGFQWGLIGAWIALVIDQILRTGLFFARFGQGKWKRIRL